MIWKKTWLSYVIWILFSLLTIGIFFAGAVKVCAGLGFQSLPQSIGVSCFFCAVLIIVLFFLNRYFMNKREDGQTAVRKNISFAWEGLAIILLITLGIFIRLYYLPSETSSVFFEMAKVAEGNVILPSAHGMSYLYTWLLRIVFLLFGNKWAAGVVLQCILQFLAGLLLYRAIRQPVGFIPSVCMFAVLMFHPGSVKAGMTYGSQMLFLCFYALGLWGVLTYLHFRSGNRIHGGLQLAGIFGLGLYLGLLAGLDLWAVTLLPLGISAGWIQKEAEREKSTKAGIQIPLLAAGCILGLVSYIVLYGCLSGKNVDAAITDFLKVYETVGFPGISAVLNGVSYGGYLILGVFFAITIFVFLNRKKTDVLDGWVFAFLSMVGMLVFQVSSFSKIGYSLFLWLVPMIATVSIREWLKPHENVILVSMEQEETEAAYERVLEEAELMKEKKSKKLKEEQRPAYNPALLQDANEHMEKPKPSYSHPLMEEDEERNGSYINATSQPVPIRTQPIPERPKVISEENISQAAIEEPLLFQPIGEPMMEQIEEEPKIGFVSGMTSGTESNPVPETASVTVETSNTASEPAAKGSDNKEIKTINYIENPLPVPKKHVKKTMDYDFEPEETKMYFDVWVPNSDDFDIKE